MMKEMNVAMPTSRINISSSKPTSTRQYLSFKAQPPRPPCWQDFIGKNISSNDRLGSNVSSTLSSSSDADKKAKGCRSKHKKSSNTKSKGISSGSVLPSQAKLKRTRSEPCIAEKEIPSATELSRLTSQRLSQQSIDEARRYLEDTYYKCSQWLAQISPGACIPLDDADFQVGSADLLTCEDETRKDMDYLSKRHSLALDKIAE